jgi:hypothetical protein
MVADLIRDSPFGHIVRLVTRQKYFQYPEEKDPKLWKKYVHEEKSAYMAHHGTAEPPEEETDELKDLRGVRSREQGYGSNSERTLGEGVNEASGARVDPEKGKDKHVISWFGDEDPQVRPSQCPGISSISLMLECRTPETGPARRSSLSHSRSASSRSQSTSALQSTRPVSSMSSKSSASDRSLPHSV